jgi:hypothetical protein
MSGDKMSEDLRAGDITFIEQNIRRNKTSGGTKHPDNQMSVGIKRPEGQNVQKDKTSEEKNPFLAYFEYTY